MTEKPVDQSAPPEPAAPPVRQRGLWIGIAVGAVLVIAGVWIAVVGIPSRLTQPNAAPTSAPAAPPPAIDARHIQATLFYVSEDGSALVPQNRDVAYGATTAEQARRIVEAQVQPPPAGFASAIPAGTTVRAVFIGAHGDAYVDLSPEAATGHSGGSLDEALAVFAIVNALTSNLPDVASVQILIGGKEVDSLAGHIDLRQPIGRAAAWIKKGP
jgi:hypothetical protein